MPIDPSVDPLFDAAAKQYNVDPDVLRALHLAETGGTGRWDQTSPAGAQGGMQFIPSTASKYVQSHIDPTQPGNPFDPRDAIPGAAHYLSDLLGDAEQQVGPGPNALTMALRNYNAGSPGHWNNPETAAYAGTVARYYNGIKSYTQAPPQATPQAAPQGALTEDQLRAQFDAATSRYTQTEGKYGPGYYNSEEGPKRPPPESWEHYRARWADVLVPPQGSNMNGIDQLAAAGQSNAPPTQMAQAGGMSDDDLLNGFVNGSLPFMPKPAAGPSPAAISQGAVPAPAQPQSLTPPAAPGGLAMPRVEYADPANAMYSPEQLRIMSVTPALAGPAAGILKMQESGIQINHDGTQSVIRGGAKDPGNAYATSTAETLGKNQQQNGPNGITPQAGSIESGAAKVGAEQEAKTRNTVFTNRPGAVPVTGGQVLDAAKGNGTQPTEGTVPGQGANYNNPGIGKGEELAAEDFRDLKKGFIANQGATQNLQNFLDAAATVGTGKGTELSGHAAAWLKSIGVDPEKLSFADPAAVEKMRKSSTQMIFSAIKGVSNRPAYQEFQMLEQANPNPDLQPEANRAIASALLGRMNWENGLYKAWDVDRRSPQAGGSYGHFDLPAWAGANPMPAFQASAYANVPAIPDRGLAGKQGGESQPQFREGQTASGPNGAKVIFRGGQWVPLQ